MRFISAVLLLSCLAMSAACGAELSGDQIATDKGILVIHPINHATFVMQWNGKTIYVDPVGGAKRFADLPKPDLVPVTHMHGDHFDAATLESVAPPVIRAFKPKIVYPYHYRSGDKTKANLEELKRLVGADSGVEIRGRDWYREE
jgi:L-ascorbate metabolism protein UlaG (beta-lactamase superfamily)